MVMKDAWPNRVEYKRTKNWYDGEWVMARAHFLQAHQNQDDQDQRHRHRHNQHQRHDLAGDHIRLGGLLVLAQGMFLLLAHLKLPLTAEGFLPIRAPPWDADFSRALAANDEIDRPFFDEDA